MRSRRAVFLMFMDIIAINISCLLAIYINFDRWNPIFEKKELVVRYMVVITIIKIITFGFFKLYNSLWEYASIDEMIEVVAAVITANILSVIFLTFANIGLPRSIYVIAPMMEVLLVGGSRFFYRIFRRIKHGMTSIDNYKRVLIIGAGAAGVMALKELRNHDNLRSKPIAFIDDNPNKKGKHINGVPVLGNRKDISKICKKYNIDEIIIAMPSAKSDDRKSILNECKNTKCKTRILPGVYELIDGNKDGFKIRDVQIEDLLGRDEIKLDLEGLSSFISGKRVLVTGGGGSIGSELCRQIAKFRPSELMILEIYENNAYDIQNELLKRYKDLNLTVFIASIRDKKRMEEIFDEKKPHIVFHAAAHKHVPLMESNPKAAIKNNVFGTLNVVQAADKYGVNRFVMISTDKAVNPTNVMGATKRVCEMIIQTYNAISKTEYVAVRFGNVLGSNGSVIPLFKRQITEGGPVTVTDERIIRYFMTIPEACQLVLQSGSMAKGGEIFILDMGEPVKIIDLARDLITLSGLEPDIDIKIEITGLRPGEKLFEELLLNTEIMEKTSHDKIYIEEPMEFKHDKMMEFIDELKYAIKTNNSMNIKKVLSDIVPTYIPYNPTINLEDSLALEEINMGLDEVAVNIDSN
ncbi:polysaccharide biosynthesis protein [Tissierella pigra]|uniref:Polysaccharide biosynthesis protein n=1 Tax=Tissierella pigra TaxID=2607614 RepID=A0A6N7XWR9_9FIRM|nr:nucleoside-diphosphate sugar epimerase/dehydratase [Tissierella pigra]MSU00250.1 polysaccharide biosynthesis protein [Tissierella pigra]